jgi:hypothetical protein
MIGCQGVTAFRSEQSERIRRGRITYPSCGVIALLLLTSSALAATPQGAREAITADDLRRHTMFLASDTLEGRAAGTQGGRAAAAYLALEFARAGLKPAADGEDFLQPFQDGYQNLLGIVRGSDPDLADEVIIVSGHFDHVGLGNRSNSYGPFGQIHNGADDNASGTAAVLAVARAVASLDVPPRRSVLFALWDAEEVGLLGSKHWLKEPTVDIDNVRLMINCDMVGRLRNDVLVAYGTRTAAGLRQHLSEANPSSDLKFNFDRRQRSDSDHWPFFERGVPYLLLHTGDHEDYHRPSDNPDKINYDGLAVISQLLFNLTCRVADAEVAPVFRAESRQQREGVKQQADVQRPPPPSRLGVGWSNEHAAGEPFEVTLVEQGSPAESAGVRVGDRITHFADRAASRAADLVDLVLAAPQQTSVTLERPGHREPLTLPLTLRGEPVRIGVTWSEDDAEPGVAIVTSVVPGSPAARAGIEPQDRLSLPLHREGEGDAAWLRELSESDGEITLRLERRGRMSEIALRPLPGP